MSDVLMAKDWEVFHYECEKAVELQKYVDGGEFRVLPEFLQDAVVESLVLHTRIVIHLLTAKNQGADDITLERLIPSYHSIHVSMLETAFGRIATPQAACRQLSDLLIPNAKRARNARSSLLALVKSLWLHIYPILKEVSVIRGVRASA